MKLNGKLLRKKSLIKLSLNSNYTYTNKNPQKLTLTNNCKKGENLSLYNGGVKIGSGINYVLVNAQIYYYTGSNHNDGKCVVIYKNNTKISSTNDRENYNYMMVNNSIMIPVTEGDVIYLYAQNDTDNQTVIGSGFTYLDVIEL